MLKKSFEFISSSGNDIITFNLGFLLLSIETNLILENQDCKRDVLIAYGIGRVKIIFILLTKILALHIQVFIVQVDLKEIIVEYKIYLTMFLVLNKQF